MIVLDMLISVYHGEHLITTEYWLTGLLYVCIFK